MFKELSLNSLKVFLKRLPEILAGRLFLTFLMLSIIAFLIGGFVFYKYYYLIEKSPISSPEKQLKINADSYQEMLNFWDQRAKKFEGVDSKEYKNPFQSPLTK